MLWINFLHIYQPPYQDKEVLKWVARESYEYILTILEKNPDAKITLNISGCLTEQLMNNGLSEIIERIKKLVQTGNIELTGSAKFHPILPLIPEKEIIRQIKLNDEINKKAFGDAYNPAGFFLPEMAYSNAVAHVIRDLGFKWIALDEISSPPRIKNQELRIKNDVKYFINDIKLQVIFRDRGISKTYVPESIEGMLKSGEHDDQTIITATDGELYGHHHKDFDNRLERILQSEKIQTLTVSEYINSLDKTEKIELIKSSWESTQEELDQHIPFALWDNPKNPLHEKLWQLANIAIKAIEDNNADPDIHWAQLHLDHGLASCTFWWASAKKFHDLGLESWNPEEINKGINQLLKSIRALKNLDNNIKIDAEYLAAEVKRDIWQTHWKRLN